MPRRRHRPGREKTLRAPDRARLPLLRFRPGGIGLDAVTRRAADQSTRHSEGTRTARPRLRSTSMTPPPLPLADWRYDGELRTYQAEVLAQIPVSPTDAAMHIVAPPGSGKTLLGLLLAAREGRRTLVLAPTVTIRQQWVRTARALASGDDQVSDDPALLRD